MIDFDIRSTIMIERRVHDVVNAVTDVLLKRGGLLQYDSALARRLPGSKYTTAVTLPWLEGYLKEHFRFLEMEGGTPVDLPPSLAKFVLARWAQFPEFRFVSTNPKRRRRSSLVVNK